MSRFTNTAKIFTQQKLVTVAGTPVQLTTFQIPEGTEIVVKAMSTNTGLIAIGYSSATALASGTNCFKLQANQGVSVQIDDPAQIWIDATVSGEGVEIICELS